jgi:hypothetical protein
MTVVSLIFGLTVLTGALTGLLDGSRAGVFWAVIGLATGGIIGAISIPCALLPQVCVATLILRISGLSEDSIDHLWDEQTGPTFTAKLALTSTALAFLIAPVLAWLGSHCVVTWMIS